ncbi:hypothetical protein [Novosphingobium subterraneum]|uniref:Uncharacterized protein n=1 Tax=Novosphingobium subterraneum TaxID=48936 RepID=A0A0B8ZHV0_9SPHN|nr:hypothetical protein [Novosphingobium subterraneum]KHS45838.1 hypothetical protein NJ75_02443 [Novosphingobium subterraneum]
MLGEIIMRLPPFGRYRSTPQRAGHVITKILTDRSGRTGVYYDEKGRPMSGPALVHDPAFQDRVLGENMTSSPRTTIRVDRPLPALPRRA